MSVELRLKDETHDFGRAAAPAWRSGEWSVKSNDGPCADLGFDLIVVEMVRPVTGIARQRPTGAPRAPGSVRNLDN